MSWQSLFELALWVAFAAFGALGVTIFYQMRENKRIALLHVLQKLGDKEHREARRDVYNSYCDYKSEKNQKFKTDNEIRKKKEMVRADFEEIGIMVTNRLFPKKLVFDAYAGAIIRSWLVLKEDFEDEQRKRGERYMYYFKELENDARIYWRKYRRTDKLPKIICD